AADARATDPVDAAVLSTARQYGTSTVDQVVSTVAEHDVMVPIRSGLVADGLLVDPAVAKARLRLAVAPLLVLLAVGLIRCGYGALLGRPVGWLGLQLVITAALALAFSRQREPERTVRGRRVLRTAAPARHTGGYAGP